MTVLLSMNAFDRTITYQQSEENENAHIPFALSRWTRASRSAAHAHITTVFGVQLLARLSP